MDTGWYQQNIWLECFHKQTIANCKYVVEIYSNIFTSLLGLNVLFVFKTVICKSKLKLLFSVFMIKIWFVHGVTFAVSKIV